MDWPVIVLFVLGIPISLAAWLIARAVSARNRIEELSRRLAYLEREISRMQPRQEPPTAESTEGPARVATATELLVARRRSPAMPTAGLESAVAPEPIPEGASVAPSPPEPIAPLPRPPPPP